MTEPLRTGYDLPAGWSRAPKDPGSTFGRLQQSPVDLAEIWARSWQTSVFTLSLSI